MKNLKKNSIWIIFWTFINILFSVLHQYMLTLPKMLSHNYSNGPIWGWGSGINVVLGGPVLGIQGAIFFLLLDYFCFRKRIKNKYALFTIRIALIILIMLLISFVEKKYF